MPKAIKKKVKKKPLNEAEVRSLISGISSRIKGHKNTLRYVVPSVIAVIVIVAGIYAYNVIQARKAAALEREAYNYYYGIQMKNPLPPTDRIRKAWELYKKAVDIRETPDALFYLGNCYYQLGDNVNALKIYRSFLEKYSSNKYLAPIVMEKIAATDLKMGKNDAAIKDLKQLADAKLGIFADRALYEMAGIYEASGKPDEAKKLYKELIAKFPSSPWAGDAKAKAETKAS